MKSKILFMFTIFLSMVLLTSSVDARRFGGGRSFGKSWSRSSSAHKSPFSSSRFKNTSKRGSMLKGALMGLVAGGLIGSLLSGGGFNGLQGLDLLLIAGVCFLLFRLYQRRKMMAGYANSAFNQQSQAQPRNNSFLGGNASNNSSSNKSDYPAWFKESEFIDGAKKHFMTLQQAWDQNNLSLIESYCSPELFKNIVAERSTLDSSQTTDVLKLDATLLDLVSEGSFVTAGIEFRAQIRSNNQNVENIIEIWSIEHAKNSSNGDWLVVGIDQQ